MAVFADMIRFFFHRFTPFLKLLLTVAVAGSVSCSTEVPADNFRLELLKGRDLQGNPVDFTSFPKVVVNFYSPVCVPCIEELPALHLMAEELTAKNVPLYMVVEGNPEAHEVYPDSDDPESVYKAIRDRIHKDTVRYGITLPVVVLDPAFRVSPEYGLITGTPETLIMQNNPLRILYNFIGPVSRYHSPEEIRADSRFQFAVSKAAGR